jgi:hypothetical protein
MENPTYKIGFSLGEVSKKTGGPFSEEEVKNFLDSRNLPYVIVFPRKQIPASVESVIGAPYKRGASVLNDAPESFDCSSLAAWVAVESGIAIPRITIDQFVFAEPIQPKDVLPGDLIFSNTGLIIHTTGSYFSKVLGKEIKEEPIRYETVEYRPGTKVLHGVDHVGVMVNENDVVHATKRGGGVIKERVGNSESFKNVVGYGRIMQNDDKRFVVSIDRDKSDIRNVSALFKNFP